MTEVAFNPRNGEDFEAGKPLHNARRAKSPLARMREHAMFEQAVREAEIEVALASHVRDAVLSFKATRR